MMLAEQQLSGQEGAKKREFVKGKVKEAAKRLDLKSLPPWLEEPIRDAVVSVIIEVCWNLVIKDKRV